MQNLTIGSTNLYYLLFYFIIFSFLGWLMETVRVSIKSGCYVNRGFANGPYCPIYGVGMGAVIVFLGGLKSNIPLLFICGIGLTTTLEYFTAVLLEKVFKAKWWDYSYKKFNYQGRVCLDISIAWGVLCVVMIELVVPFIDKVIGKIPLAVGCAVTIAAVAVILFDVVMTALSLFSFSKMLHSLDAVHDEIKEELEKLSDEIADNLSDYIDTEEIAQKIDEIQLKTAEIKQKIREKGELIKDVTIDELKERFAERDFDELKTKYINNLRRRYTRYFAIRKAGFSRTHRRILRAFPALRPVNKRYIRLVDRIRDKFL